MNFVEAYRIMRKGKWICRQTFPDVFFKLIPPMDYENGLKLDEGIVCLNKMFWDDTVILEDYQFGKLDIEADDWIALTELPIKEPKRRFN